MFEKTQKAAIDLSAAATEETSQAVNMVKAMVVPTIAGLFNSIATAATKAKENVESGDFFSKVKEAANSMATDVVGKTPAAEAAPLPTEEQNTTISVLQAAGKTDEEIATILGVSVLTVKMAWGKTA